MTMKVKVSNTRLSQFLSKFFSDDGKMHEPSLINKMLKFSHIIGNDEEIGLYLIKQLKQENLTSYDFERDDFYVVINFSVNTFPLTLTGHKIFFNRGGRDMEIDITSPLLGDDVGLDISYRTKLKIYKLLFNYR